MSINMDEYSNPNGIFTLENSYNARFSAPSVLEGVIIDRKDHHSLGMTYDVRLLGWGGIILREVRVNTPQAGNNGEGHYISYEVDNSVTLLCPNGIMEDAVIIGGTFSNGNYEEFYSKGNGLEPGKLVGDGQVANQASIHPNRVTQPHSNFIIKGANNIKKPYDSAEHHEGVQERADAWGLPGIIEMNNTGGNKVTYAYGSIINYTSGNIINVTSANSEDKCTNLLKSAQQHAEIARLLQEQINKEVLNDDEGIKSLLPYITKSDYRNSEFREAIPLSYKVEQHTKLAKSLMDLAQQCNRGGAATGQQISSMSSNFGEQGSVTTPKQVPPPGNIKEEKASVHPNNFQDRIKKNADDSEVRNKLIVVIHETGDSAESALKKFNNPIGGSSYHALIKRDGTVVYLVSPDKQAYGASCSHFPKGDSNASPRLLGFPGQETGKQSCPIAGWQGEYVQAKRSDKVGGSPSIDAFAYHISLETPEDGRESRGLPRPDKHSGYTEAQYKALGYVISRTGVSEDRITTHKDVDRSNSRIDPLSFDWNKFKKYYNSYPKVKTIDTKLPT